MEAVLPFRTGAPASDANLRQGDPIGDERGGIAGDHRLERLIDRLPRFLRSRVRWLRQPSLIWLRIPAGILLIAGGLLSFLPILGLWMLPLGRCCCPTIYPRCGHGEPAFWIGWNAAIRAGSPTDDPTGTIEGLFQYRACRRDEQAARAIVESH